MVGALRLGRATIKAIVMVAPTLRLRGPLLAELVALLTIRAATTMLRLLGLRLLQLPLVVHLMVTATMVTTRQLPLAVLPPGWALMVLLATVLLVPLRLVHRLDLVPCTRITAPLAVPRPLRRVEAFLRLPRAMFRHHRRLPTILHHRHLLRLRWLRFELFAYPRFPGLVRLKVYRQVGQSP